jgi:hypothetical protein
MLHAEEHPKHDGHVHECASTTWEKCSCSAPRTPRVARVRHGGLVSLSLAALYALRCGRGRVVELLEGGVEPGQTCPSRRSRREKDVPTMMEVVEPGQTCRWRLKEVEEDMRTQGRTQGRRMIP